MFNVFWRDGVQAPGLASRWSPSVGRAGRHKAGSCGEYVGLGGRGLAKLFRLGTRYERRHQVGEACCRRGGVAGAEPPHKGGPNRPDRPELQWLVVSGQWSVVSDHWLVVRGGASPNSGLKADWTWLRCYPRFRKDHPNDGMHPFLPNCFDGEFGCARIVSYGQFRIALDGNSCSRRAAASSDPGQHCTLDYRRLCASSCSVAGFWKSDGNPQRDRPTFLGNSYCHHGRVARSTHRPGLQHSLATILFTRR